MAESRESPALKRKREGKEPQRKRSKTDKKSRVSLGETDAAEPATPVAVAKKINGVKNIPSPALPSKTVQVEKAPSSSAKPNWRDKLIGKSKKGEPDYVPTPNKKKSKAENNEEKVEITSTPTTAPTAKPAPTVESEHANPPKTMNSNTEGEQKMSKKRNKKKNKSSEKNEQFQEADDKVGSPEDEREVFEPSLTPTDPTVNGNIEHTWVAHTAEKNQRKSHSLIPANQQGRSKGIGKKNAWSISTPVGGWFLPQDPVFSVDEKFLILANTRGVHVYSTETSLLINSLPVGSGVLVSYALSSTDPHRIYIANSAGLITLWDWAERKKIGRWEIGTNIRQLIVATQAEIVQDLVYCHEVGTSHVVNVHALRTRDQKGQTELKRILKAQSSINNIEVLSGGNVVVVTCTNSVLVGTRSKLHKTALQDLEYTFRELTTSTRITALCSYIPTKETPKEAKRPSQQLKDTIDIAIGDDSGVIHLFEDILSDSTRIEKSQKKGVESNSNLDSFTPKRLHWHRGAIGSLKWSLDGNYIVSGGDETVLVIWQLSTGKQQHLPHLTAAIENIVVSPSGAYYAVSLANNSVIVLSTTELEAKTNITGVQSRRVDFEQMPRESDASHYSFDIFSQVPMAVDPKTKNQVIFSTPSSQPRRQQKSFHPEPYVQTFNLATQIPVSRQALTRNNATDPNMGPAGRRIYEPNIKFMQYSHDGNWLATVDEWYPPRADMTYVEEGIPEFNDEERSFRRESYLKFWEWNENSAQWALQSRVDAPHLFEDVGAVAQAFDLVPDPSGLGFATVGADRTVRIWRPKTRMRNGVVVRGADMTSKGGVVTWSLDRSIELSSKLDVIDSNSESSDMLSPRTSRLAFSADGSVLAVGVSWSSDSDPGIVQVIDTFTGTIRRSITELDVIALSCIGIMGRHLIVVGDSITVWDLVLDQPVYCIPFDFTEIDQLDTSALVRLAVNDDDETFAVACPQFEKRDQSKSRGTRYFRKPTSKVSVFGSHQPKALWSTIIPEVALSLIAARDGRGYIVLDSSSSLRTISPRASALQLLTPPPETVTPNQNHRKTGRQENDMDSDEGEMKELGGVLENLAGSEALLQNSENDKPVVRKQQLQQVFESQSHALPPVKDLFDAVVDLYARKPRNVAIN